MNSSSPLAGSPRRVILAALGSAGDVHPFVGIGLALKRRGHDVAIIASDYFGPLIRSVGLEFIEMISKDEYGDMLRNPDIWHPLRGPKTIMQQAVVPMIRRVYDIVARRYEPGRTIVGASTLALGARVAQDKLGVPTATIHLQPVMLRSNLKPGRLAGMATQAWLPRSLIAAQYWLADRLVVDQLLGPELNGFRRELGLPPVKRIFDHWLNSPSLTIGMFPAWFAPPQPDWIPQVRLTGFPLYDEHDVTPLGTEVEKFLAAGSPPIAFTPGSAMTFGQKFFAAAVEACERLGRRGILLTRHPDQIPQSLPESVRYFDFVPFTHLVPRCAALVHHGGIGSMSQGFAAGVPQVVMPMSHDQPDNIERAIRLGVGAELKPKHFTGERLAAKLRPLLESPDVQAACRTLAEKLAGNTALDDTAKLLESLLPGTA
ncbi:MAG: glycosyltransferase [Planctomycetia bacterium]|nr:glycosyltransferase [Planctomycetia bacterium]